MSPPTPARRLLTSLTALGMLALSPMAAACTTIDHTGSGTVEAELAPGDCAAGDVLGGVDNSLADIYEIQLVTRSTLTATLASAEFDPFLIVLDDDDVRVAEDDDSLGNLNATLTVTLEPGTYRVVANSATTALEVGQYVLSLTTESLVAPTRSRLANISTRGATRTDAEVMIGGLIISGDAPKRVLIRGVGPSLEPFGVAGALLNPTLALYDGPTLVDTNETCSAHVRANEIPDGLLPTDSREACIVATLAPGGAYRHPDRHRRFGNRADRSLRAGRRAAHDQSVDAWPGRYRRRRHDRWPDHQRHGAAHCRHPRNRTVSRPLTACPTCWRIQR